MRKLLSIMALSALITLFIPATTLGFCADTVAQKYQTAAQTMFDAGVLKGNPDGSCTLDKGINRVEFAVMAMCASVGDEDAQGETCQTGLFKDLNDCGVWYGKYAATAKELGVLKGDGQGNLRATDPVNGAEAAVITARAAGIVTSAPKSGETWYDPTFKIFSQNSVTTYAATHEMTRGEVILMLYQVTENYSSLVSCANEECGAAEEETPAEETSPAASASTPNIQLNYRVLVEYFEYLSSAEVTQIYRTLTPTQILQLGVYNPFGELVHLTACQADSSLVHDGGTGNYKDCAQQVAAWAYTSQPYFAPGNYSVQQRDKLLIGIKCATGEIDQGTCSAYSGAMGSYGSMVNDTSMRIIENIGGQCRIGVDPGCHY